MSKTREHVCIHYENEHNCKIGREGTFYHYCQTCGEYKKKPGSKAAREDTRRERLKRAEKRERYGRDNE